MTMTRTSTASPSLSPALVSLLHDTTQSANLPLTPGTLGTIGPWIAKSAPAAFQALQAVNTFAEGRVLSWGSPCQTLLSTLLADTFRYHGPALRTLAAEGGETLTEKALPVYASRGCCAMDLQLNAWTPDSFCAWHDHECEQLGMIVVEGSLLEERFSNGKLSRRLLRAGEMVLLDPTTIHRLGGGTAVTLHAYGGGLRRMTRYQCGGDGAPLLAGNLPVIEAIWAR